MRIERIAFGVGALLACLGAGGCGVRPVETRPAPRNGGDVYLYLRPTGGEHRLDVLLAGVSARRGDGSAVPLALELRRLEPRATGRERLLAHGAVPAGDYAGLALTVESANLRGPEGPSELRVPGAPVAIEAPFRVVAGQVLVLTIELRLGDSLGDGFSFEPRIHAGPPSEVATGLLGLATSRGSDTVTLFDKVSGQVAAVIRTGPGPAGIAVDPARRRAYVALARGDGVEAIDLQDSKIVNRLRLGGGDRPAELALTPDGRTLITANSGSNSISFVDPLAVFEVGRLGVGDTPRSVIIDADGRRAYVFNSASSTISVVDVPRRALVGTIPTDGGPFRGQLDRNGDRLFVIHEAAPYLTVVDPAALSVIERVYVGRECSALRLDPKNGRVYLARRNSASIDVYDPFSLQPVETIPTGGDVAHLAIDDEGNNLLLVEPEARRVRVLRLVSKQTVAEIDLGDDPFWVSAMGER